MHKTQLEYDQDELFLLRKIVKSAMKVRRLLNTHPGYDPKSVDKFDKQIQEYSDLFTPIHFRKTKNDY